MTEDPRKHATPRPDHSDWGLSPSELPRMIALLGIVVLLDFSFIALILWCLLNFFPR